MKKKPSFLIIGSLLISVGEVLFSLLCFPGINWEFFSQPSGLSGGLWIALFSLSMICAAAMLFSFRKELPLPDLILPLPFLPCLFAVSWIEAIYLQYDTVSKNAVFNAVGFAALAFSVVFSVFRLRRIRNLRGAASETTG
ncbi:MAG: hypothetical protein IJK23_00760 [Clostridia bacterium]|nr:hypothetical protein [Clostridia bacterium]